MTDMVAVFSKVEVSIGARLQRKITEQKTNGPHTWTEERFIHYGPEWCIRGTGTPRGVPPTGYRMPDIANGAAMSLVPREFIETWLAQNSELAPVKSGMIFLAKDRSYGADKAKELTELKCPFRPLDPIITDRRTGEVVDGDPRWPKARRVMSYGAGEGPEGVPSEWAR